MAASDDKAPRRIDRRAPHWTAEDLKRLAGLDDAALTAAVEAWHRDAPPAFENLLEASVVTAAGETVTFDEEAR